MRIVLRRVLVAILPERIRKRLKIIEFNVKKRSVKAQRPWSISEMRGLLVDQLGLRAGDTVMVHGSFSLLNFEGSPTDLVTLILDVIGEKGNLAVPLFCRGSSIDFIRSSEEFDVRMTPSGMGAISEAARAWPEMARSIHPTKSIGVIGPDAEQITCSHHLDKFPFGAQSPFRRLIDLNAKIIGVGVPASYLSLVHVVEEMNDFGFPVDVNLPGEFRKKCIDMAGRALEVETKVHDLNVVAKANPEKFCGRYMPSNSAKFIKLRKQHFFYVDGRELFGCLMEKAREGKTIYDL